MKKITLILAGILFCSFAYCQSCLPEGIEFTTQAQIDSFQADYPGCTEIVGGVRIAGTDITSLEGLSMITSIGGFLYVIYCTSLSSLTGLENLTYIGNDLGVGSNSVLTSLEGLENVSFVGATLFIIDQDSLTGLQGLEGVTAIGENLEIESNDLLINLSGLENIISVGDQLEIYNNSLLNNLSGLESLNSIGHVLIIQDNYNMQSLDGIENLDGGSLPGLRIYNNTILSECAVKSVCESLAEPGGNVYISNNAEGCKNEEEVLEDCAVGVGQMDGWTVGQLDIRVHPNPSNRIFNFQISIFDFQPVTLKIFNIQGQAIATLLDEAISSGEYTVQFDASSLSPGIYFYRLIAYGNTTGGKLIVLK